MEQNTQASENDNQTESGILFKKPKKKSNNKIVLLVGILMVIFGAVALYFLFFSNKEDDNIPVLENEKVEEVKIDKGLDSDQDGLPDYLEKVLRTDENNSDTDGDGYSDFEEIKNGYNPFDDEKYTEEEWEAVKEKIRNESGELYEEMFGEFGKTADCDAFPDKLDLCDSFSCEFEHMLTGEVMERKIIGLVDGKCQYTEEMPNDGRMDCEYSESLRKAVAQYYRNLATAESAGTNIEANLGSGDVKTTYTIDGKEVENPLQEAMDSGQCIILGNNNNEKIENSADVEIEWGQYYKSTYNMKDDWMMDINITNNHSDIIAYQLAVTPNRGYDFITDIGRIESSNSDTTWDRIYHSYDGKTATFEKYEVTLFIYECEKLPSNIQNEICIMQVIDLPEILEKHKKAGNPIQPTSAYTKYYNIFSVEVPPSEISEDEYLN